MSVFIAKVPVFSGGRGKITLHKVVADCLEDWEDLLEFLGEQAKGKSWVVTPKPSRVADWYPTSRVLPFAKVRQEVVGSIADEFSAPMLETPYIMWAQYHLKMEMRRERGVVEDSALTHHGTRIRELAFRLRKYGLTEPSSHEFPDRGQRAQVKIVNTDIENLDLGKWRRLNPPQTDL